MDYSLIEKYLSGEATEIEVKLVFQWIESSPENRKEFVLYKKAWALTARSRADKNQAWENRFARKFRKDKAVVLYASIAKYAAMVIAVFGLGLSAQYFLGGKPNGRLAYIADTKIQVPLGQMANVELPDGTSVMLNSGSTITYNGRFSNGERLVSLEGEAFFNVFKDEGHPFRVQTAKLDFKVYGTSFNIESYPGDEKINVTLVEGSLGINNKAGSELTRLVPGENATFDANGSELSIQKIDINLYTSWKNGLITFRNEKLKDIASKIERWYNVEIVINNPALGEEPYFGTIMKNKPIDQILEVLKLTSSLEYSIVTRTDQPTLIYWN